MTDTGVIILAHGSRGEKGILEVRDALQEICEGVRLFLVDGVEVIGAALQFNRPSLEDAVERLASDSVTKIVIVPYFLFPGRHITEHIPHLIEGFKGQYPEVQFTLANTLGREDFFISLVARRILECAPELSPAPSGYATDSRDIEKQSMEIVEQLLPDLLKMPGPEQAIVKRIVHASGDPGVAHLVRLSPSAIPSGLGSIAAGNPILTDVRMVAAGINRGVAQHFGCPVICSLDEIGQKSLASSEVTRSAAAIRQLGAKLNGAVVAIGNAPTALFALMEMVDNSGIKPALVIGMPVGFVQAQESKEELLKRDVPYITVVGTRGGSAMAAATVNALLKIAAEEKMLHHPTKGK